MTEAIVMTVESVRTRASTSEALITLALPLEQASHLSEFLSLIGEQIGVAFAKVDNKTRMKPPPKQISPTGDFGQLAKVLRLSSFFRTPDVWKALGTDEQFIEWLRGRPCDFCGEGDYIDGTIHSEAAHVRRVENGSGVGIKPRYSAISLCRKHHDTQHQEGEQSLGGRDWMAQKRIQAVQEWCWITLKDALGYDSWKQVPPEVLVEWAVEHEVDGYLPIEYLRQEKAGD